jgi:predicted metalloprotease with PDZ domain
MKYQVRLALLMLLPLFLANHPSFAFADSTATNTHHEGEGDEAPQPTPTISYTLAMPQPQTHFFEVTMRLTNFAGPANTRKTGFIDLKMPVWTPGSYLIREYAKNVEGFSATINGQPVVAVKSKKNTWRIATNPPVETGGNGFSNPTLTVHYRVYANELTVRTSFVDDEHGYVNGASMFVYQDALRTIPHRLTVQPYTTFKKVTTSLPVVANADGFVFEAPNFDILVDSPIEIGNHRTFTFMASGVPHTVAQFGAVDYNERKLSADYQKICEAAASVVGEHPGPNYTFIVHHTSPGGGGLEHLNSTSLQPGRNPYATETEYRGFLTLVAHEYFHLWNVKRIRPFALGPFDYENENYTRMLWEAEGFTSFYEDYLVRRAGFTTPEQYLGILAGDIGSIENQSGNRVQSVAEASFDAWIKYYRPNENSRNSTVSYYTKGAVLASLLNLAILDGSDGARSLDDVLRFLYQEYYKKQQRGFTDEEFKQALEQAAGHNFDAFFAKYVNGTEPIDYAPFFAPVGIRLSTTPASPADGFLGATTAPTGGKATVTSVRRDGPAWTDGLNVGDEIIALDSIRVLDDPNRLLASRKPNDVVRVLINRAGILRELPIRLADNPLITYKLEPLANLNERQKRLYVQWLWVK